MPSGKIEEVPDEVLAQFRQGGTSTVIGDSPAQRHPADTQPLGDSLAVKCTAKG